VNIVGIPATESTQLEYVEHNVAFFPNGFVGRESPVAALTIVYGQNGLLNPSRIISNQLATDIDLLRRTPTVPFANYQKELQSVVDLAVQQSSVYFLFQSPMILATKGVTGIQKFIDFQQFEGVQLGS
jgi:peptide/nickel transport system substrate-binding protein